MSAEPETARIVVSPPAARSHLVRRIGWWVASLVVLLIIVAALAVAVVPAIGGATPLTVLSGSMVPTLPVGSTVVVRPRPVGQIKVGDIISFTDREQGTNATRTVTHRVIEVLSGPAFRTKGDANNTPDPHPVAATDVHGVEWYDVPLVGLVKERLFTRAGLFYAVGIVLLVVAAHLLLPETSSRTTEPGPVRWRREDEGDAQD